MKQYTDFTIGKAAAVIASLAFFWATSCKNPDSKVENTEPTTVSPTTPSDNTNIKNPDSGTVTTTNGTAPISDKVGKPNPAKKGGKGRGTITWKPYAGTGNMEADKEGYYTRADVMPSYPGGEKALIKFMEDNIQYPEAALDEGVEGTVQLSFAVDEAGKIYTPVVKSEKMGYGLEEEAIRVIQKMPKWNPGSIKGKNVKTRFEIPVTYVIN
jgi:protein TonB